MSIISFMPIQITSSAGYDSCQCVACDLWPDYPYNSAGDCQYGYECVEDDCSSVYGQGCCQKITNECDYCQTCNLYLPVDKQCPPGLYCDHCCGENSLYGCCKEGYYDSDPCDNYYCSSCDSAYDCDYGYECNFDDSCSEYGKGCCQQKSEPDPCDDYYCISCDAMNYCGWGYECDFDDSCSDDYKGCCKQSSQPDPCDGYYCTSCDAMNYCDYGYECDFDDSCSDSYKGCCKPISDKCEYCEHDVCVLDYPFCPDGFYCDANCGHGSIYGCCTPIYVPTGVEAVDDTASTDEETPVYIDILLNDDLNGGDLTRVYDGMYGDTEEIGGHIRYTPNAAASYKCDHMGSTGFFYDYFYYEIANDHDDDFAKVTVTVNCISDPCDNYYCTSCDSTYDCDYGYECDFDDSCSDYNKGCCKPIDECEYCEYSQCNLDYPQCPYGLECVTSCGSWKKYGCCQKGPEANDDEDSTDENTPIVVEVLENDISNDGPLSVTLITDPDYGIASVNPDDTVTYAPGQAARNKCKNIYPSTSFDDTFDYEIENQHGLTDQATVTITIDCSAPPTPETTEEPLDPPTARDDFKMTNENTAVTVEVLNNDDANDGGSLDIIDIDTSQTQYGMVHPNGDGTIEYTPKQAAKRKCKRMGNMGSFDDYFDYTIRNSNAGLTDTATVTIEIYCVPQPTPYPTTELPTPTPTRPTQSPTRPTQEPTRPTQSPTRPTQEPTRPTQSPTRPTQEPTQPTESPTRPTPPPTPSPTPEDEVPPTAEDDFAETTEGDAVNIFVLVNDNDPDGDNDNLEVNFSETPTAEGGTTVLLPLGPTFITYTPPDGRCEELDYPVSYDDTFEYNNIDEQGLTSNMAEVTVTVSCPQPPTADDDTANTQELTSVDIPVLDNDSANDGGSLFIVSTDTSETEYGDVDINGLEIIYTPTSAASDQCDEMGNRGSFDDTFEYTIQNTIAGLQDTATVTVTITCQEAQAMPVPVDDDADTDEDTPVSIDVLENDIDTNEEPPLIVIEITSDPDIGSAEIDGDSLGITYTPESCDDVGAEDSYETTLEYRIEDNIGAESQDSAEVTITVNCVDECEITANDDEYETDSDEPITTTPLSNDDASDGCDDLELVDISTPDIGTAEPDGNEVIYTPDESACDGYTRYYVDEFIYVVKDESGQDSDSATVTIKVKCTNYGTKPSSSWSSSGKKKSKSSKSESNKKSKKKYSSSFSSSSGKKKKSSSKKKKSSSKKKKSWSNAEAEAESIIFNDKVETNDSEHGFWSGWLSFIVVASITLIFNAIAFSIVYKCCFKTTAQNAVNNYEGLSDGVPDAEQVEDFSDDTNDDEN